MPVCCPARSVTALCQVPSIPLPEGGACGHVLPVRVQKGKQLQDGTVPKQPNDAEPLLFSPQLDLRAVNLSVRNWRAFQRRRKVSSLLLSRVLVTTLKQNGWFLTGLSQVSEVSKVIGHVALVFCNDSYIAKRDCRRVSVCLHKCVCVKVWSCLLAHSTPNLSAWVLTLLSLEGCKPKS